ncbi:uncharacterized protein HMPREF1541_07828 [Cyphellophora europaea CBS 101466]|uniref:Vegetatible incompatibility protein HET-E-1 n=1 Tax=Cyphellophora europaea (strain CBS 101466) TaxID=1220924 RepID=W2RK42_CYPE1|nr:uncharacterized protein HMPREF1541_07828 [Cyphellophora europaea CBS 101466]ETN36841.1 hypothetical protein HMPREF1541_07828 [Cyphellophora europaea CBS 101466]
MDVEAQRLSNLEYKQKLLDELQLQREPLPSKAAKKDTRTSYVSKKRKLAVDSKATRSSARLSSNPRPSYKEDDVPRYIVGQSTSEPISRSQLHRSPSPPAALVPVKDVDTIRAGWVAWTPTAPLPTRSDSTNAFHFEDHPTFTPNKSPAEVLREGCFGGSYWRPLRSRKLGIVIEDDWRELPTEWISGLDPALYLTSPSYNADVNKFGVACGQSIEEWEAAGWIAHNFDVRGWFQWYCRFFQGRRCDDDERQISRWRKCVGETGRWRRMLLKKYIAMGVREVFDDGEEVDDREVSPVMHQTCHHWAYEVRQEDLDRAWAV